MSDPSTALIAVEAAFGVPATYTPPIPGAAAVSIVVIREQGDQIDTFSSQRVVTGGARFEVRKALLADPVPGGVVTLPGQAWRISDAPQSLDPDRLVWTLDCVKAKEPWR